MCASPVKPRNSSNPGEASAEAADISQLPSPIPSSSSKNSGVTGPATPRLSEIVRLRMQVDGISPGPSSIPNLADNDDDGRIEKKNGVPERKDMARNRTYLNGATEEDEEKGSSCFKADCPLTKFRRKIIKKYFNHDIVPEN